MFRCPRLLPAALLAAALGVHGGARAQGEGPPAAGTLALSLADDQDGAETKSQTRPDDERPVALVEVAITGRNARNGLALLRASDDRLRIEPAQVAVNPGSPAVVAIYDQSDQGGPVADVRVEARLIGGESQAALELTVGAAPSP